MHLVLITKVSHLSDIDISREISLLFKSTPTSCAEVQYCIYLILQKLFIFILNN